MVNPDGSINTAISGNIVIGSVSATVDSIFVQSGVIVTDGTSPIDPLQNNPALKLEYVVSGTTTGVTGSEIGSVVQFIGAGSFVQVLSYSGNQLTDVGSWV